MTRHEWLNEAENHDRIAQQLYDDGEAGSLYEYHCRCASIARQCANEAAENDPGDGWLGHMGGVNNG